jgi:hypothetical protein
MTDPSAYPSVYSAYKSENVPNYSGGVIQIDLGTLPAGAYVLHVVVSASVGTTATTPENRDLYCVLATPGSDLRASQSSFPSLSVSGNAFMEMPMQATLSTANNVSLKLRCEILPVKDSPDVKINPALLATAVSQIHQL